MGPSRRQRRAALVAVAVASLGATRAATAQGLVARLPAVGPTAFTLTSTSLLRYRGSNFDSNPHDEAFFSLTERLDAAAQAPPWRLSTRLDGFVPWNHDGSCPDAGRERSPCVQGNLRPERLALSYRRGDLTLELGDFYQVFGRGVALAFRKVDPVGLDATVHGARAEWDHERLTLRAFAGLANPQNLDPLTLAVFSDPFDVLAGASAAVRLGADDDLELGVHALRVDFERYETALAGAQDAGRATRTDAFSFARLADDRETQARVDVAGLRVEAPALLDGALSAYAEANLLRRASVPARGDPRTLFGRAVYGAAQWVRGRWTLRVEWKDYTHFLVAPTESNNNLAGDLARIYSSAPTLEREDQRVRSNANARGGRVRVDYALGASPWSLTASALVYGWAESFDARGAALDPWDPHQGALTTHSFLAVRRRARPVASLAPRDAAGAAGTQGAGVAVVAPGALGGAAGTRVGAGDYALTASAGYRREFYTGDFQDGVVTQAAGQILHESYQLDVDWAFAVGPSDSLEVRVDNRFERNWSFDHLVPGMRGGVALTWSHGLPLVVSAMLRWDDTHRDVGQGGMFDQPMGNTALTERRLPTFYPSMEVRWNFSSSNFVRVFGGMTPGGPVCSGGACRVVPLFQGALAELVLRR